MNKKPDPFRCAGKKVRQPNDDDDFEYDQEDGWLMEHDSWGGIIK